MSLFGWSSLVLPLALALAACEGPVGPAGPAGVDGVDGANGANGADGANGANGANGVDGADGQDGQDAGLDPLLSPVDKAFAGIGGQAAVEALAGVSLVVEGADGIGYEGYTPDVFFPAVSTFTNTVQGDLAGGAWRIDVARENWFFGFPAAQTFSEVLNGDVGEIQGTDSILGFPSVMPSDRWAAIGRNQRLLNPHLILAEVAADPALASEGGEQLLDGSVHHLVIVQDEVAPITLWVNAANGHIAKLQTWENDPTFSDVRVEVFYYGWTLSDGALLFPSEVYVAVDGQITHSETRTATVAVNPTFATGTFDLTTYAVPYDAALAARGAAEAQYQIQFAGIGIPQGGIGGMAGTLGATELSPGVWHLTTLSHHSLVVEQASGLVLLDAPLDPELGDAILDWTAAQFPTKPVSHVVVSHHHRDHVGGLRSLVAAGATVVVHEDTVGYYDDIFSRPRTIRPDALAQNPVPASFELVPDQGAITLEDPAHPVKVFSIGSSHAADMVVPVLENDGVAFSVDIYSPGFGVNPLALELYLELVDTGISLNTIAGGHGIGTQTWDGFQAELVAAGLL